MLVVQLVQSRTGGPGGGECGTILGADCLAGAISSWEASQASALSTQFAGMHRLQLINEITDITKFHRITRFSLS